MDGSNIYVEIAEEDAFAFTTVIVDIAVNVEARRFAVMGCGS